MDHSTPGFPVLHCIPEIAQTRVHWVGDAIQPYHPLSSPSLPAFNLPQHQVFSSESVLRIRWTNYWSFSILLPSIFPQIRVFSNESALHIRWPKFWRFSFSMSPSNGYSGLVSFRTDWSDPPCSPRNSQESSPAQQFESINSSALSLLYGPTLTSVHDYWKNHSFDYVETTSPG